MVVVEVVEVEVLVVVVVVVVNCSREAGSCLEHVGGGGGAGRPRLGVQFLPGTCTPKAFSDSLAGVSLQCWDGRTAVQHKPLNPSGMANGYYNRTQVGP